MNWLYWGREHNWTDGIVRLGSCVLKTCWVILELPRDLCWRPSLFIHPISSTFLCSITCDTEIMVMGGDYRSLMGLFCKWVERNGLSPPHLQIKGGCIGLLVLRLYTPACEHPGVDMKQVQSLDWSSGSPKAFDAETILCVGGSLQGQRDKDVRRLDRLVKKELGGWYEAGPLVGESTAEEAPPYPWPAPLLLPGCLEECSSGWLLSQPCQTERLRHSFVPAAIRLYNRTLCGEEFNSPWLFKLDSIFYSLCL